MLEDLLGGALGAGADLVRGAEGAGERLADRRIELFVDRDPFARRVQVRLEGRDALGELADTVGEGADDVAGRA